MRGVIGMLFLVGGGLLVVTNWQSLQSTSQAVANNPVVSGVSTVANSPWNPFSWPGTWGTDFGNWILQQSGVKK